ncbi:MAG: Hsp20/alpha crystallin family protein [Myxococcota bacterium]
MFNVDQQTARVEQLYRQLTGMEPRRHERPSAPIPPDANPEQYVQENLQRLEAALQSLPAAGGLPTFAPRVSVFETEQEWRCAAELPGVKRGDLVVQVLHGVLRLSALRAWPGANGEPPRPTYAEALPCRFERSVPMPLGARTESADARLENGILTVKVVKDPAAIRRDLKIEVA